VASPDHQYLLFTPDGRLITGGADSTVLVWER
jgi:hypothetical protein